MTIKPKTSIVLVIVLALLLTHTAQAKTVIPINSDGEVVLPVTPVYEAGGPCLWPRGHIKSWRRWGFCRCVIVMDDPYIRATCRKPRKHFHKYHWKWKPCPCVRRLPPKDELYGGEGNR